MLFLELKLKILLNFIEIKYFKTSRALASVLFLLEERHLLREELLHDLIVRGAPTHSELKLLRSLLTFLELMLQLAHSLFK